MESPERMYSGVGRYYGLVVMSCLLSYQQTLRRSMTTYRIAFIFDMQLNINKRIALKQDGPSPIIEGPQKTRQIVENKK